MATITINKKEFLEIIGKKLTDTKLEEIMTKLGVSLETINEKEIIADVLANRPDFLSYHGLARSVSYFIGAKKELKQYKINKSNYTVNAEKTTNDWPYVTAAVVKNLKFDDIKIKEIIQLQEKIGATLLRNRKKGGIGIYPLNKIKFPIKYTCDNAEKIKFRPLEFPYPISGKEILEKHPTGREYKQILQDWRKYPIFIDSENTIMSMPPIINSHDVGKITEETKEVFVEATGTDFNTINIALNIIITTLADFGGEIYGIKLIQNNKTYNLPDLAPKDFKYDIKYINKILGLDLNTRGIKNLLQKMGYGATKKQDLVLVPAYRSDILHQIDIAEDAAIAYGYENIKEEPPNISTIAQESGFEIFKRKMANILIGLGLLEVHTYNLTSKTNQTEKMHSSIKVVELANSLNQEYNVLRAWIIPSLLQILKENKHNELPQNIFSIGHVFKYDAAKETGIAENARLGIALCHTNANFTEVKQILDSITRTLDLKYEIREKEHDSFIAGRAGRINIKEIDVAYIGEIHPEILDEFGLETPVSVLEINLSELYKVIK